MDNMDVFGIAAGVDAGLQQRRNEQLWMQGIRPTFWERHYILPYGLGLLLVVPVGLLLASGGPAGAISFWTAATLWVDKHVLFGLGFAWVLMWLWPIWLPAIISFRRAERRYRYDRR